MSMIVLVHALAYPIPCRVVYEHWFILGILGSRRVGGGDAHY